MSDTKQKLIAAFEKLGVKHASRHDDPARWSATDLATDLADILDTAWLLCPNCKIESARIIGRDDKVVECTHCGMTGPRARASTAAIILWERIRMQGVGPDFNVGIQAIDDIHSIFEDCQRRGMKAVPIGRPGCDNDMRRQIERFIRKIAVLNHLDLWEDVKKGLDKLMRLGNGGVPGNSDGNIIAAQMLSKIADAEKCS